MLPAVMTQFTESGAKAKDYQEIHPDLAMNFYISDEYLKPQLHTQLNRGIAGSQGQLEIILQIIIQILLFPTDPELSFFLKKVPFCCSA